MRSFRRDGLLLACAVLAWTSGCTESLAPREPYDDSYSIYGLLTPDRDTQFVWVYPIEEFPTLGTPHAHERVTVTSTDLETGEFRTWTDTVLVRENGQHEYLYRSAFRAEFDRRYRVEIRDDVSDANWAEIRIPPAPLKVEVVDAGRDTVTVDVFVEDVNAMRTELEYLVRRPGPRFTVRSYRRQYWGEEQRIPGGWRIKITLNIDRYWVDAWYAVDNIYRTTRICPHLPELQLGELRLHILIGDTAWAPPGPAFDPYILSQPGTMQNVENGSGFIGGGYRVSTILDVPQEAVEAACFVYCSSPWNCPG